MIGIDLLLAMLLADEPLRVIDHGAVQIFIESRRTDLDGPGKILVMSGGDYNGDSIADKLVIYTYEPAPNSGDKPHGMFAVAFLSEIGDFHKTTEVMFIPETELVPDRLLGYSSDGSTTVVEGRKRLPGDSMCCPSAIASVTFAVEDEKVVFLNGEFERQSKTD